MSTIINHSLSFHPIDLASNQIPAVAIGQSQDISAYANEMIESLLAGEDQRDYKFVRTTTEVSQALTQMVGKSTCAAPCQTIANRLLETEKAAQQRIAQLGRTIQKGSLFQIVFQRDGAEMVLLAKVDLNSFLDQTDFKKHAGLPFERRVLKTCLVEFSAQNGVAAIKVSDTHNAEYWWKHFLELEEIRTNESNTLRAFHSIDHLLSNRLKKSYPSDYTYLRNNLVGYFRTQRRFSFAGLQKTVFGSYRPDGAGVDMVKLNADIQNLPTKHKFDSAFDIKENEIKARFRRVISLTDKISLQLSEDVENLHSVVEAKSISGKKGIFIKSEEGYDAFHRPN